MKEICAKCNICTFMPKQTGNRILSFEGVAENWPLILVIDDAHDPISVTDCTENMRYLLNTSDIPFTYTTTIRCDYEDTDLTYEQKEEALAKCSVWTNSLLEGRALVITTVQGLQQIKLETGKTIMEGDMFRSPKLGVVLVIPPLSEITGNVFSEYKLKVQRVLKEAGLL